jgi:flagellar protein FliL
MKYVILLILVAGLAAAAGYVAPLVMGGSHGQGSGPDAEAVQQGSKLAFVTFGDVVVNLAEERLTRFLRVKLILVVDTANEKQATELVQKNKAILKNWLISHMADKGLQEVSGAGGVNRLRREIQDQFNALLYQDGSDKIRDVLFEEFVVQ